MSQVHLAVSDILSFRHMLVGELQEFLRSEGLDFDAAAAGLGEVLVALSRYREEGIPLYPSLFLCEDLPAMMQRLGGRDHFPVGSGPREPATMRTALKHCAPLGLNDWSIYVVQHADRYDYGLFRTEGFVLSRTAMGRMRELLDRDVRIVGVVQLAENVLELRGSAGGRRLIYLSGAPSDALPAIALIRRLSTVATWHVDEQVRQRVQIFLQRVFIDAMRAPHGSLIAVLPQGTRPGDLFNDGIVLERPIQVPALVRAYQREHAEVDRASVQAASYLLQGMLSVDGITVLTSDGAVVAYNAFLRLHADHVMPAARVGGARRRAFQALSTMVGSSLVGAFMRSQDGLADCDIVPDDSPLLGPPA